MTTGEEEYDEAFRGPRYTDSRELFVGNIGDVKLSTTFRDTHRGRQFLDGSVSLLDHGDLTVPSELTPDFVAQLDQFYASLK